jgi:hypothetical protein
LDKDKFDLRVDQTFASRTFAELAAVTADIPAGLTTAKPPAPARAQGEARILRPSIVLMVATVPYAGMWLLLLPLDDPHRAGALVGIATLFYSIVVIFAGARLIEFLLTRMLTTDLEETTRVSAGQLVGLHGAGCPVTWSRSLPGPPADGGRTAI